MQGEDIHINLWLTKQKIIIGLVVCFRLFDVMVPGVFFFFCRPAHLDYHRRLLRVQVSSLWLMAAVTTMARKQTYYSANGLPEVATKELVSYLL